MTKITAYVGAVRGKGVSEICETFARFVDIEPETKEGSRRRLFFPARVFWMFLTQVLAGNISCHETLQRALAWLCFETGETASPNTAGFCKARQRLCPDWLGRIQRDLTGRLEAIGGDERWIGRQVKVVDGSGLSMPDTSENQEMFPQSKRQKKGCGFPTMRIVALFSLSTGILLKLTHGALEVSERALFHKLWEWLEKGDVLLGDRGFTSFADFFLLLRAGVDCVMRNNARRTEQRVVKRFARHDKLVAWKRTGKCPNWVEKHVWRNMPVEMIVRQIDLSVTIPGFRTRKIVIVTTLLDHKTYHALDFIDLYRRRWLAELFLRDIKTSMGMDVLKCKTPEMVLKEITMYIIAYNLVRALMLQAANEHGVSPLRISFKRAADALRQWTPVFQAAGADPAKTSALSSTLLHYIARCIVPDRPNRTEPRALKRRKKNYQLLNKPRHMFKEIPHRNHYTAGLS